MLHNRPFPFLNFISLKQILTGFRKDLFYNGYRFGETIILNLIYRFMKSKGVAYLLWFFLGIFSAHRFYLEKIGSGILYLLTFQLFGIGWIIDLFIRKSVV